MKKYSVSIITILIFLGLSAWATGPRITPQSIQVNTNEIISLDLPPFISTEVANGGMLHKIVTAAFKASKIEVLITTVPLQHMVKYYLLQENALAIMGRHLGISKKDRRSLMTIPLLQSNERYLFHKKHRPQGLGFNGKLSSLKGLRYGASKGESIVKNKSAGILVKKGRSLSLFKKLQQGKIDFMSVSPQTKKWFIKKHFAKDSQNFMMSEKISDKVTVALYFNTKNKKAKRISKAFKLGLKTILQNGTYAKILKEVFKNDVLVKQQVFKMNNYFR